MCLSFILQTRVNDRFIQNQNPVSSDALVFVMTLLRSVVMEWKQTTRSTTVEEGATPEDGIYMQREVIHLRLQIGRGLQSKSCRRRSKQELPSRLLSVLPVLK